MRNLINETTYETQLAENLGYTEYGQNTRLSRVDLYRDFMNPFYDDEDGKEQYYAYNFGWNRAMLEHLDEQNESE